MANVTYIYFKLLLETVSTDSADNDDLEILIEDKLRELQEESGVEVRVLDFEEISDEELIR